MADIVHEQVKASYDKAGHAVDVLNEKGMLGLEWIDRIAVAPGWLALYNKENARLIKESLSADDASIKAATYADDITGMVQPDSRKDHLASMFKGKGDAGEIAGLLLQFTQSLNVIWQNIRYDLPEMIRQKEYMQAVGIIAGYTMAGLLLGAVTIGFDPDDDDEEKARKLLFWATTQFTDAVPLLGSEITRLSEAAITGKTRYRNSFNLFPALESALKTAMKTTAAIQEQDFDQALKAAAQALETGMLVTGAPVSGAKELGIITGITGDDGPKPGAALGRR
jgi:hypothetical protein